MQAPIVQLDVSIREPIQSANNSPSLEKNDSAAPSSFAKELEKAMGTDSENKQTESVPHQIDNVSQDSKDVASIYNAFDVKSATKKNLPKTVELSVEMNVNMADELVVLDDSVAMLAEENLSIVDKKFSVEDFQEVFAEKEVSKQIEIDDSLVAESLPGENLLAEKLLEKPEKKGEKKAEVAEDEILPLLSDFQQNNSQILAQGAEEVVSLEVDATKQLKLETGTQLDSKISVMDYRSAAESGVTEASLNDGNFVTNVSYGEGTADITFNLNQTTEKATFISETKGEESRFASMLSNQLQNNAADMVKTGSIVLRDGNTGTINLILHPEQLGNVKISLELHDKIVSAQITVASEEAFQAFKESISSLKQAFAESGFQTGGFDLAWSGSDSNAAGQNSGHNENFAQNQLYSVAQVAYGEVFTEDFEDDLIFEQKMYSDSTQIAVNIMA